MNQLNPRQREAVLAISGPVLVLAGAGSGKTSVITQKIAYLITECGISANKILAVTFTNKAAREMKERAAKLVSGPIARGLSVSTFHTLGLTMIKRAPEQFGLKKNFSIFDAEDSNTLLGELLHKENASDKIKLVRSLISNFKNELITPAEAISRAESDGDLFAATVYEAYERHLRAYNAVDFDDLIVRPTLALRDNDAVREQWQNKVHYLLVDEYQDTNSAQYLMVKLLVGSRACFTAVGDDDQSIYAWRGARPENMAELSKDYPALKVIMLEQNYRSTSRILKAANAVIANNPHVFEKKLWSQHGMGATIRVVQCPSEDAEAEKVATELLNHKLMQRTEFRDYAVLYRGNFQARALETKLREFQIPYKISGGQSFFGRSEIKDVMAYLRLVINPEDDNAFLRIVNTPKREIGPSTLEKLGSYAQQRECAMLLACDELGLGLHVGDRALSRLQEFSAWIASTAREIIDGNEPLNAIKQMLSDIDYNDYLLEQSATPQAAERRMESVNSFLASVQRLWEKAEDEEDRDIEAVIRKLVLLDLLEQQAEEDDSDKVQLMTLHAAKGLEFPHVFLVGLEEDLLPHRNSIEADTVEEERRLMYVGITRAKQTLTLTYSAKRKVAGEMLPTTPSRFLDELPADDLDWEGKSSGKSVEQKQAIGRAHLTNLRDLLG
ncbi:ATP-dependent DNA helicase Rep [Paraperlucidibaca baekdonensis]|uniref:ATP-dependent DNA helicase Rep n=1 Tax=Paraperlucidibaca baekdonensis TaxID=748120 RepID=A0A3E0H9V4_9GAMM|nr:DNA helicase Rep [Paraperlucidibaca baekdonensis]REH39972.1 ATP-dependent DNA helicase Rep [Paraperlucidibaca baekdonensis]